MIKKILIVSGGVLPVPAVKGGAVETLIDSIIKENSIYKRFEIDVVSCHCKITSDSSDAKYINIRYPLYVRLLDRIAYLYMEKKKDWRSMFVRNHYKTLYYKKKLKNIIDYDLYAAVIVENNMSLLDVLYEQMGDLFSEKCFYHMHSVLVDNPNMLPYLSKCKKILAVSNYVVNELKKIPEFKNTSIEKVTNGIELPAEKLAGDDLRELYKIPKDACVFLYMGRLSVEKGARELLEAFIMGGSSDSVLVFAGSAISGSTEITSYVSELMQRAETLHNRVIFTGYIPHENVGKYYNMADALAVPSIVGDAAPLTIIEGMTFGIPIIAARTGGIPEYSENYTEIVYVDPGEQFVERLSTALTEFTEACTHKKVEPVCYDEKQFFESFCNAIND